MDKLKIKWGKRTRRSKVGQKEESNRLKMLDGKIEDETQETRRKKRDGKNNEKIKEYRRREISMKKIIGEKEKDIQK